MSDTCYDNTDLVDTTANCPDGSGLFSRALTI